MGGIQREGDLRVQIIICFFFLCVIGGGVLLGLYIFLPESESSNWYYVAGIALEGIPWAFWLLAYIYTCFKPRGKDTLQKIEGSIPRIPSQSTRTDVGQDVGTKVGNDYPSSPLHSLHGDDHKHVHFGAVVVLGNDDNYGAASNEDFGTKDTSSRSDSHSNTASSRSSLNDPESLVGSSPDSVIPLTKGVSSCR